MSSHCFIIAALIILLALLIIRPEGFNPNITGIPVVIDSKCDEDPIYYTP